MDKIKRLKHILQKKSNKNLETDAVPCPDQNNDSNDQVANNSSLSSIFQHQDNFDSLNNSLLPSVNQVVRSNSVNSDQNNIRIGNTNMINGQNITNLNNELPNANIRLGNLNHNNTENQQLTMTQNNQQITSNIQSNNLGITNVDGQNVMVFDRCKNFQIGNKVCVQSKNVDNKTKTNKKPTTNRKNSNDDRYYIDIEYDGPILEDMRNSTELITNTPTKIYEKFLSGLSKRFTTNYQSILRDLDIEQDIIDGKRIDYHMYSTTEVIFQILLDWARNEDNATWNTLTELFMMHKKKKCIRYMIDYWRDSIYPGRYPLKPTDNKNESSQQQNNFESNLKCNSKSEKIS